MRRWFVILMLFILPVRGFIGDAMAYSMLGTPTQAALASQNVTNAPGYASTIAANGYMQSVSIDSQLAQSKMPCHDANEAMQTDNALDKQQCSACEVCHMTVTYPFQANSSLVIAPAAPPVQHASSWHSAELRLSIKPPVL